MQTIPETWKHLQPLKYNPILQLNLSQAHQHIDANHFFSLLSFAIVQAETLHTTEYKLNRGKKIEQIYKATNTR